MTFLRRILDSERVIRELLAENKELRAVIERQTFELAVYDTLVGLLRKGYDA